MTPADLKAENAALTLQLARFAAAIEGLEEENHALRKELQQARDTQKGQP